MNAYLELINKVKKINRQAALIMARKLPLRQNRNYRLYLSSPEGSRDLRGAFIFSKTPQGHDYWYNIFLQLEALL